VNGYDDDDDDIYDAKLHDPILLLKIPMGTRKNSSENYQQFGHALSKSFASPQRWRARRGRHDPHMLRSDAVPKTKFSVAHAV
jgi:hypothetical protein